MRKLNDHVPQLNDPAKKWWHFVDGTFVYVKWGSIECVFFVLNLFHGNIKFTYEQEKKNKWPFLNVLFIRDYENINITIFRKDTHNDLYLHWDLFLPISWK